MDFFKLKSSDAIYPISKSSYEKYTDKKFPYCQFLFGRIRYLGICPLCSNPINIINLYVDDSHTQSGKKKMHGRHFPFDVPGLARFNPKSYKECPYHRESAPKLYSRRPSKNKNLEVVRLMKRYKSQLRLSIEEILGIQVSETVFDRLIKDFIHAKGYYFTNINKYNLPFYFLYLLPNEILYNCLILDPSIEEAIEKNSKCFFVNEKKRLQKSVENFAEFEFIFVDHLIEEKSEFLFYELIERKNNVRNTILNRKIKIDATLFYNKII
ncbi:hypothetical protein [Enterococcus dispar]|uniref:hypothetical protein n=1 Tax=Enterococcus dispar TaxID=44009 RepID=UPI002493C326|nr:hypothetical protein [Enterococcus dispar]